jgi:hypothetical protein
VSKGSRINVNFADSWSGRWESNPRPNLGKLEHSDSLLFRAPAAIHIPFAQIKSPESCYSHVPDYAAETVWVATSTIFSVGHVGQLTTTSRELSDCSITS